MDDHEFKGSEVSLKIEATDNTVYGVNDSTMANNHGAATSVPNNNNNAAAEDQDKEVGAVLAETQGDSQKSLPDPILSFSKYFDTFI